MQYYNTQEWTKPLIQITKSDTVQKLRLPLLYVALFTAAVAFVETKYFQLTEDSMLANLPVMHSILGFAISMLLVFRTNSAYDRWWEGRKLWGSLVNNCRNLSIKINTIVADEDSRNILEDCIANFPKHLMNHLLKDSTRVALDDEYGNSKESINRIEHSPIAVVTKLQQQIQALYNQGKISGDQLIILNPEIQSLLDICGACERIKNTPIPYSYSAFIKKFIVVYVLSLPFGFVLTLSWLSIPVVTFVFYVLASLEIIAEEIEDPFGLDGNDLPMEKMSANIATTVKAIFSSEVLESTTGIKTN